MTFGPCESWEIDESCCDVPDDASPALVDRMRGVSTELLWAASGRVYGPCPVTVRPCLRRCLEGHLTRGSSFLVPYLDGAGHWRNAATCGCGDVCACGELCEIPLEGPVAEVTSVRLSGDAVTDWRLDRVGERTLLVRTGTACWPVCQDLTADDDAADAFSVTYQRGLPLTDAAVHAHSELTCELVRACLPNCECRLPRNVQSKTRQGISIAFDLTQPWIRALPAVASWLDAVNPDDLPRPMRVMSPDVPGTRRRV